MKEKNRDSFEQCLNVLSVLSNCASLHILIAVLCYKSSFTNGFWVWILLTLVSISLISLLAGTKVKGLIMGVFFLQAAVMGVYTSRYAQVPERFIGWSMLLLTWSVPEIRYCMYLDNAPKPESRENDFLFVLATLLIAAGLMSTDSYDSSIMIPQITGLFFALLQLVLLRTGGQNGAGKRMKSIGLLIIPVSVGGMVWGFFRALVPSVIRFQTTVEHMAISVLFVIGNFLSWLLSLIPVKEEASAWRPADPSTSITAGGAVEATMENDKLLLIVVILFTASIFVVIVYLIRRIRLPGRTYGKEVQIKREISFGIWLKEMLAQLKNKIFKKVWLLKYRNTPQGYYLYLEHHYGRLRKGRKTGETSREFLERLAEQERDIEIKQKYLQLADWMEEKLWGVNK